MDKPNRLWNLAYMLLLILLVLPGVAIYSMLRVSLKIQEQNRELHSQNETLHDLLGAARDRSVDFQQTVAEQSKALDMQKLALGQTGEALAVSQRLLDHFTFSTRAKIKEDDPPPKKRKK